MEGITLDESMHIKIMAENILSTMVIDIVGLWTLLSECVNLKNYTDMYLNPIQNKIFSS